MPSHIFECGRKWALFLQPCVPFGTGLQENGGHDEALQVQSQMLYSFVRTSCNAPDVTVSLMSRVLIKQVSDENVAEGPTTSLVVRDFAFSNLYC
jgi:hypothetical protein